MVSATSPTRNSLDIKARLHSEPEPSRGRPSSPREDEAAEGESPAEPARDASVSSSATTHSRSLSQSPARSRERQPLLYPVLDAELSPPIVAPPPSEPPPYDDPAHDREVPDTSTSDAHGPSMTSPRLPQSEPQRTGSHHAPYGTISNVFLARDAAQAEDMGGDASQPLLGERRRRRGSGCCSCFGIDGNKLGKILSLVSIVLLVVGAVVGIVIRVKLHHGSSANPPSAVPTEAPGLLDRCRQGKMTETSNLFFVPQGSFSFTQRTEDPFREDATTSVRISGQVEIKQLPLIMGPVTQAHTKFRYSHASAMEAVQVNYDAAGGLELVLPNSIPKADSGSEKPCLHIETTVFISPSADLEVVYLSTDVQDVIIPDNAIASSLLSVETHSGRVQFPKVASVKKLDSRDIRVKTNSGKIEGHYPLCDSLDVSSNSGSISIEVQPKEEDKKKPKPARLTVHTNSGSIDVRETNIDEIAYLSDSAKRDFRTSISSNDGKIQAWSVLHGSETSFRTNSGSIHVDVIPVGPLQEESDLQVESNSGSVEVDLKKHLLKRNEAIHKLSGRYIHHSGTLKLNYPSTWEGKLEGYTNSGAVNIDWPGMEYSHENQASNTHYHGKVGKGDGVLYFTGNSGRTDIHGGR